MKRKLLTIVLSMLSIVIFNACNDDDIQDLKDEENKKVTYEADVMEVFGNNIGRCGNSGCHAVGSRNGVTATYEGAKELAESGRLIGALEHQAGFSPMPKFRDKIPAKHINTVKKWIEDGLLEK
jgi:hypothetical protein